MMVRQLCSFLKLYGIDPCREMLTAATTERYVRYSSKHKVELETVWNQVVLTSQRAN